MSKMIDPHPKLVEAVPVEDLQKIIDKAISLNMGVIKKEKRYRITKTFNKETKERMNTDSFLNYSSGNCYLLGAIENDTVYCWIYIYNINYWGRTSPIMNCRIEGNKILIETENSVYSLVEG